MVKNLPANAGDTGLSPGLGRSHVPRSNYARVPQLLSLCSGAHKPQLPSPRATTTEAHVPGARAPQQEKPPQWEACTCNEEYPHSSQLEKARVQQQRPNAAKNK